jgi:cytochrome c-type biogenesis protein CcmH
MRAWPALLLLVACEKAPAPSTGREAVRGLPPASSSAPLPAGHPSVAAERGASLEGTLEVAPALQGQVKPGDTLYLVARSVGADGTVTRMPLAVSRLTVGPMPMTFTLSAADVMMQGSPFAGAVQITARVDKDGDAMTRNPGDVEGVIKAEIPARGLKIVLDTPVKP